MRGAGGGFPAAFRPPRLGLVPDDGGTEPSAQIRGGHSPARDSRAVIREALPHDSAELHVSGKARYVDDLPEPPGTLFGAVGVATATHAKLISLDLEPVRRAPGVVAVIAAADIPGNNNIGPVLPDEPVFAAETVEFRGQPLFAVAATRVEHAGRAARLARAEDQRLEPALTVEQALERPLFGVPSVQLSRGYAAARTGQYH